MSNFYKPITVAIPPSSVGPVSPIMLVSFLLIQLENETNTGFHPLPTRSEFPGGGLILESGVLDEPDPDKVHAVYGYLSWGFEFVVPAKPWMVPNTIFWMPPVFINWTKNLFVPPRFPDSKMSFTRPSHFRFWAREGIRSSWALFEENPTTFQLGGWTPTP